EIEQQAHRRIREAAKPRENGYFSRYRRPPPAPAARERIRRVPRPLASDAASERDLAPGPPRVADDRKSRGLALEAAHPIRDQIGPHRPRDEKALGGVAAERGNRLQRIAAVDALGNDAHLKGARELDDHANDLPV